MKKRKLNRNRIHIDPKKLYNDYVNNQLTAIEIANKYNCSYHVIYNRLNDYKILRRKGSPKRKPRLNKKELINAYIVEKLGITRTAKKLNVGRHIVERDLKFYKIPMRDVNDKHYLIGNNNHRWKQINEIKFLKLVEEGHTATEIINYFNVNNKVIFRVARKLNIKFPNVSKKKIVNKLALKQFKKVIEYYYYDLDFNRKQILEFLDLTYISLANYFKEFAIKLKPNKSPEEYYKIRAIRNCSALYHWKKNCLKRDNYTCQTCGKKDKLQVHHILTFMDYPEYRFDTKNGITLCGGNYRSKESCHYKAHYSELKNKIQYPFIGSL